MPSQLRSKLESKAIICIFIGYSFDTKVYRLFNQITNKVITSRDVIFDETLVHPMVDFHKHNHDDQDIFEDLLPTSLPCFSSITDLDLQQGGNLQHSMVGAPSSSASIPNQLEPLHDVALVELEEAVRE